jgi:hypothetical protein
MKGVSMNLRESWNVTCSHLERARTLLPSDLSVDPDVGSLERYHEWMEHNELELAFNELEGLGEINECPQAFWQELLAAAENMQLDRHAQRCRTKLVTNTNRDA